MAIRAPRREVKLAGIPDVGGVPRAPDIRPIGGDPTGQAVQQIPRSRLS